MSGSITEQFAREGFIVIRGLLTEEDASFYTTRLTALADGRKRWTQPDGVNRHPEFWSVIVNERLLAAIREIFGPDARYLPHNDLHVGISSFSWHRDSVNRTADGPDWDETHEPYRIARAGIYLQPADSGFKLGLVKRSHRRSELTREKHQRMSRRTSAVAKVFAGLSGIDVMGTDAEWIPTDRGDCIIFDPRVLHTGSRFHGEKYAMFVAYGIANSHFQHHWHYYLHLRSDLGYSPLQPALAHRLRSAGLLAAAPPADLKVAGAWVPSRAYTYLARRFR